MEHVLNWIWQGSLLAVTATVACAGARRVPAGRRYGVWWAVLAGVLLLAVAPALPSAGARPPVVVVGTAGAAVPVPGAVGSAAPLLLIIWLTWALWSLARLAGAFVQLGRLKRGVTPFPSTVEARLAIWRTVARSGRPAQLALSEGVHAAAVLGGRHPVIALSPRLLTSLRAEDLERVVLHEWAHVQRRDDWTQAAQQVIRALFGLHPAVWWIARRLQLERELACDERVVAATGSPRSYAECLLALAAAPRHAGLMPAALGSTQIATRIERLARGRPRPLNRTAALAWTVATLLVVGAAARAAASAPLFVAAAAATQTAGAPGPIHALQDAEWGVSSQERAPDRPAIRSAQRLSRREPDGAPRVSDAPQRERDRSAATPDRDRSRTAAAAPTESPVTPRIPPMAQTVVQSLADGPPLPGSLAVAPPPVMAMPDPRTPWGATADAGVAIGRGSTTAARATAGFFTRMSKSIAERF